MSKVAVVYWSSTGNTEAMADAVVEGAKEKGADVTLYECADFRPEMVGIFKVYDADRSQDQAKVQLTKEI